MSRELEEGRKIERLTWPGPQEETLTVGGDLESLVVAHQVGHMSMVHTWALGTFSSGRQVLYNLDMVADIAFADSNGGGSRNTKSFTPRRLRSGVSGRRCGWRSRSVRN